MIIPWDIDFRRGSCGICMVLALGVLFAGDAPAESFPSTAQAMKFEDFELELPKGLSREDFYLPPDNPMSKDKVALGRTLFFDPRLSGANTGP